jgi:uncharacterized protein YprB with RNaseH-like and TPR domain
MAKWTQRELDALNHTHTFQDWMGATSSTTKSYDAWEKKRRVVEQRQLAMDPEELDVDELALLSQSQSEKDDHKRISKALVAAEKPNLGATREFPNIITFEPAYFDLETTNLKANFGRILCASVADMFGNVRTFRIDEAPYARTKRRDDIALAVGLRDYLEQFDVIMGWYSKMFDIPFLNTRLLIGNERPLRADIMHVDAIWKAKKGSMALHSARLDALAKTFRLDTQKTVLDPDIWQDASDGDKVAMDYVVEHCEADVLVLRKVFYVLKPLIKIVHR